MLMLVRRRSLRVERCWQPNSDAVYFYSMARVRVCSVCGGTSLKRVLVQLPSGRDRVTDFEACEKCKLVFLHPDQSPLDRLISGANHRDNVPADGSLRRCQTRR